METRQLYYEDCNIMRFSARVLACQEENNGFLVRLDQTAFYPEGGGQPCDLGVLGDVRVLDVREKDGAIVHLCDGPLVPGSEIIGVVDYQRRLDLMQQHSGEHIVSGVIHALFGAHNVGFHMGADVITIDFDVPIPADRLTEIEERANAAIFQNLPIRCWYPAPEELPKIKYRSKKKLDWPVRIVEIPGYDSCACCGVHVAATGQIGIIKLLSCVKFHQGVRMEMVCGGRALALFSRIYEQNRQVSQAFSAKLLETGEAAQKMNKILSAEKYRSTGLQRRLFERIAADYAGAGDVMYFDDTLEPAAVRDLADRISDCCSGTAAIFSGSDEAGYSVCLANKQADIKDLGQAMNAALNGRGGGKSGFFQGSVNATRKQIEAFFTK